MPLSILDGNQTATTLSTVLSAGAHIPAHTVVSLGVQSIIDITNAVWEGGIPSVRGEGDGAPAYGIGIAIDKGSGETGIVGVSNPLPIAGTVTASVTNSVTIGSLPSISGTVTVSEIKGYQRSVSGQFGPFGVDAVIVGDDLEAGYSGGLAVIPVARNGGYLGSDTPVNASVTNSVTVGSLPVQLSTTTIAGTARLNVTLSSATTVGGAAPSYANLYGGSDGTNLRAISVDTSGRTVVTGSVSLTSTTVTVSALPSGALTTRFGSVTTANTAQITSAVTNTSRKYLLAQNISSGTVTIGIGFSPTTTQGIQLTAGAGISFDSFCPTGAVYWLGATTGATFTILEG